MRRRRPAAPRRRPLTALLTATLLAGCGGASSAASGQLHDGATSICTTANHRLARIAPPHLGPADEAFLKRGIAVLEPELRRLRRLRPQSQEQSLYSGALNATAQEVSQLKRTVRALERNQDPSLAFPALQRRLAPLEAQANGAWRALQIPACLTH